MDYRSLVRQTALDVGVDPNIAEAVLAQESGGNPSAVSSSGATGLMQLMPGTAKELGVDPRDPAQNILGGVRYLKQQIDKYGVEGGLAAYNAGPGRVEKVMSFAELPSETQKYVPSVMNRAAQIAMNSNGNTVSDAPPSFGIGDFMGAFDKAKAAGDVSAMKEIGSQLQKQFTDALSKAQAAGDKEAVNEISGMQAKYSLAPAAPVVAPKPTESPKPVAAKEEPLDYKTLGKKALRAVDDAVRGAADTLTFGFADEIAAKMNQLTGRSKNYDEAVKAERARDAEGGAARLVGQVAGGLVPSAAVVRGMDSGSRLVRAGAGAATGAIQGGLYGAGSAEEGKRLEGVQSGAALGALTGGVLGGVLPATVQQKGSAFIDKAGSKEAARLDAEIVQDLKNLADNSSKRGNPLSAIDLNAIESKYINDAQRGISALSKTDKKFDAAPLRAALQDRRALTADDLSSLRTSAAGNAVADAIEKAQRTRSMTQATQSSGGIMPILREGVDLLPVPAAAHRGLKALLGGRETREVVAQKALKNAPAAENVLERLGPSSATQSLEQLQQLVQKAQAGRQAAIETAKQTAAQTKADKEAALLLKQQQEAEAALEAARAKTLDNANKASQQFLAKNRQQLLAERAAQEAEQAALEAARKRTVANANQAGQTAAQQASAKLLAERRAELEAQQALEAARGQTLANANAAGRAANASNTQALLAERQTGQSALATATSEQAKLEAARAETLRKANEASLANMKRTQAKLRAERGQVDDSAVESVLQARWAEGKTANGGVQGVISQYTGLTGKNLVDGIDDLAKQYPQLAPHLEKIKTNQPVQNVKTLGVIQDALTDWAATKGIKVDPSVMKKQAVEAGITGAKSVPDSLYKKASGIISSLDDGALSSLIGKEVAASGEAITKPRSYATGKLAKILHDQAEGRALDAEAQGILKTFMK